MKGITLWQPWATAMAIGKKTIETRSWPTHYRGDILICSAVRKPEAWQREILHGVNDLPLGCALCIVELFACVSTDGFKPEPGSDEALLGDYSSGRWAWKTRNLRTLKEPIRWRGKQGLWIVSPEQEKLLVTGTRKWL